MELSHRACTYIFSCNQANDILPWLSCKWDIKLCQYCRRSCRGRYPILPWGIWAAMLVSPMQKSVWHSQRSPMAVYASPKNLITDPCWVLSSYDAFLIDDQTTVSSLRYRVASFSFPATSLGTYSSLTIVNQTSVSATVRSSSLLPLEFTAFIPRWVDHKLLGL